MGCKFIEKCIYKNDTTIGNGIKPTVIYGGLTVDSCATLNIASGSTIYFHGDAGINVYGRIISEGTPDKNIILRGDRTDNMFDYLPYDNVSGQWLGIHFMNLLMTIKFIIQIFIVHLMVLFAILQMSHVLNFNCIIVRFTIVKGMA